MKISEIIDLVGVKQRPDTSIPRALRRVFSIGDMAKLAHKKLPRSIVDYLDGGADDETSLAGNPQAFGGYRFTPAALNDVQSVDLSASLLGEDYALPLGLAPTGYTRMMAASGEGAVHSAARAHNVPYVLSTMGTTSLEELAIGRPTNPNLWFQLYVMRNRDITYDMVRRAAEVGSPVLEVAIDTAVSGNRLRDRRNGLSIPPRMTLGTIADIGTKPAYWAQMLTQPALDFSNIRASDRANSFAGGSIADITAQFDPSVSWEDIAILRDLWPNKLVLKGTLGAADAARAVSLGVDGIHLSNHGGRQLDRSIAPVHLIREVREAVGNDVSIIVDSGVRSGGDIAVCLALGADAAFVGRPYLWALAAAGQPGVERMITILGDELRRTLQLLGVVSIAELRERGHELVRSVGGPR